MQEIRLQNNELSSLPDDVFTGLTVLKEIRLHDNELSSLPEDPFTGLTALKHLWLQNNELISLPDDVFTGLTALIILTLSDNELSSLPDDVFTGLTALKHLWLANNELSSLPDDPFTGLTALEQLWLANNELSSLPDDVFTGLTALENLYLADNELSSLPEDPFTGLTALEEIHLDGNKLSSLPAGAFIGLTQLDSLQLQGNTEDPLPLTVTLEKVGSDQVRAEVLTGAPFAVDIPVTVANGALDGGATELGVATGSVEGTPVTVTRTAGTTAAVTADIDLTNQPSLPSGHDGYSFARAASGLPKEIFPDATNAAPSFSSPATFDAAENQTVAGTVLATDSDAGDDVTGYAITGGADQAFFSIGATDGALAFKTAPNFEDAKDQGNNNTYVVEVTATSGTGTRVKTATQTITVTVTDVDTEAPGKPGAPTVSAASVSSLSVNWSAPDNAGPAITDYDVQYRAGNSGGWSDGGHAGTAVTATLTGLSENTSYQVQVRATNAEGTGDWSDSGSGTTDANAAPSFSSSATISVDENATAVVTVVATDDDAGDDITGYEITGGADRSFFSIGASSGALTFDAAPNFEDAKDQGSNNTYVVVVTATSGTGTREKTATQTITVTVTDEDEAPGQPAAPDVSAASATSLTVSWSAPANAGPAITDYDVRYREGTSGSWNDGGHTGTATTATLSSLSEGTSYQVQVRATNAEGTGDWSDSGSGTTDPAVEEEDPEPINQPSEIWAYWTDSETKGSNLQEGCASTEPFRAFWNPPKSNGSFKVADEWEAKLTPENGASNVNFTIPNTGGDPKEPELTGTVDTDGYSVLSIRVRGRFGDEGWGAWSPTTELFCMPPSSKKPLGLAPNAPNPFNPSTVISYRLATPGAVRLEIYNLLGQPVRTLVDQVQAAGAYRVRWDARDGRGVAVAAGVYLVRLHYPGGVQTQRLLYLK